MGRSDRVWLCRREREDLLCRRERGFGGGYVEERGGYGGAYVGERERFWWWFMRGEREILMMVYVGRERDLVLVM